MRQAQSRDDNLEKMMRNKDSSKSIQDPILQLLCRFMQVLWNVPAQIQNTPHDLSDGVRPILSHGLWRWLLIQEITRGFAC